MADENGEFSLDDYYSLLELLDKLGKEGVAELVSKGRPQRITRGDMIYFLKSDVNRILGEDVLKDSDSVELIVDDELADIEPSDLVSQLKFTQTLVKRQKVGKEQEIYCNYPIDVTEEVLYGRSHGYSKNREAFKDCGIISSLHGKLYLDEENNLLYENLGANKSKIRGSKDKNYTILDKNEVGVLIDQETLEQMLSEPQTLTASIKLGYQLKPHFIVRITVDKNK